MPTRWILYVVTMGACLSAMAPAFGQGPFRGLMPQVKANANPPADANAASAGADANDVSDLPEPAAFLEDLARNLELFELWAANTPYQWLILLGAIFAGVVVGRLLQYALRASGHYLHKRNWPARSHLLTDLAAPASLTVVAIGLGVGLAQLSLTDPVRRFAQQVLVLLLALAVSWYLYNLVSVVEVLARRATRRTRSELDDMLVPLLRKTLRIFVLVMAGLFIAQNVLGANITSWLAGLGIAGLAVSLAAQDSLKHLFGSVTIFFDRPFLVGSFIKYNDQLGTVEEIGFRSTRMRTLDGHLMTIPNGSIVNDPVTNIGARPYIRRVMNVTITYDTPAKKIEQAVQIVRDIFQLDGIREWVHDADDPDHPDRLPPRVYFSDYNATSLNIVVYYWYRPADWWAYLAHCERFNLELFGRYEQAGIEFAFPTQTLYLAGDPNRQLTVNVASPDEPGGTHATGGPGS